MLIGKAYSSEEVSVVSSETKKSKDNYSLEIILAYLGNQVVMGRESGEPYVLFSKVDV